MSLVCILDDEYLFKNCWKEKHFPNLKSAILNDLALSRKTLSDHFLRDIHIILSNTCLKCWNIFCQIRYMHRVTLTSQHMTVSDLCPKQSVYSIMIHFWWNMNFIYEEIEFLFMPWVTLNFPKWPWEVLVHYEHVNVFVLASSKEFSVVKMACFMTSFVS
jgi:hypothetical protein